VLYNNNDKQLSEASLIVPSHTLMNSQVTSPNNQAIIDTQRSNKINRLSDKRIQSEEIEMINHLGNLGQLPTLTLLNVDTTFINEITNYSQTFDL
jgi:hypothetical protein